MILKGIGKEAVKNNANPPSQKQKEAAVHSR
jgi:hypothetical protein